MAQSTAITEILYAAELSGLNEVPPTTSGGEGTATFKWIDNRLLYFRLVVSHLTEITAAHIHMGAPGTDGPIVATLYSSSRGSTGSGLVVSGYIHRSDLMGPLKGQPLSALVRQMNRGNTYVNVHTIRYPNGAIRGQIKKTENVVVEPPSDWWREGSWS